MSMSAIELLLDEVVQHTSDLIFGEAKSYGENVVHIKMLLMGCVVAVISALVIALLKCARMWEDHKTKDCLPVATRDTSRHVRSRKHYYGRLGTIHENQVFALGSKNS